MLVKWTKCCLCCCCCCWVTRDLIKSYRQLEQAIEKQKLFFTITPTVRWSQASRCPCPRRESLIHAWRGSSAASLPAERYNSVHRRNKLNVALTFTQSIRLCFNWQAETSWPFALSSEVHVMSGLMSIYRDGCSAAKITGHKNEWTNSGIKERIRCSMRKQLTSLYYYY